MIYIMDVNTRSTLEPDFMYNSINNFVFNKGTILIILVVIILYISLFSSLGGSSSSDMSESSNNSGSGLIGIIMFIIFLLLAFNLFEYFFSINVSASLHDLFSDDSSIDININQTTDNTIDPSPPIPEITTEKQVFNIPQNQYTYNNAKALCKAYGAELADYEQIEDSYNNGGEWCSYGWSKDQLALYPTQQKTYDKLQCIPGHEHDCGRPGINGGYIANPNVKFGVNCCGYKPEITSTEAEMLRNTLPYPRTQKNINFENQVDYWKSQLANILVSPFNKKEWSE